MNKPVLTDKIRDEIRQQTVHLTTRAEKTRLVATQLFFVHGIYPSAQVIREITQHGSVTDINADLRYFWSEIKKRAAVQLDTPTLPDELTNFFGQGLIKMWDFALEHANKTFDAERHEFNTKLHKALGDLHECQKELALVSAHSKQVEQNLEEMRELKEQALVELGASTREIETLRESLQQWQQKAADAETARQQAQDQFAQELEAERSARKRDAERLEGDVKFAMMQIHHAREQADELRRLLDETKSTAEKNLTEAKESLFQSQRHVRHLNDEKAVLQGDLVEARLKLAELEGQIKAMPTAPQPIRSRKVSVSHPSSGKQRFRVR